MFKKIFKFVSKEIGSILTILVSLGILVLCVLIDAPTKKTKPHITTNTDREEFNPQKQILIKTQE